MKLSLFTLVSFLSFSAFAASLKTTAELDLRKSAGVDAGYYRVTTEITPAAQASQATFTTAQQRDDNRYFCVTTVQFPVGNLKVTVQNVITGEVLTTHSSLVAETSQEDSDETCTKNKKSFAGEQTVYVSMTNSFVLPVSAPKGYDEVVLGLQPYQTLRLNAKLSMVGSGLTLNPQNLFELNNIFAADNGNRLVVGYYLFAQQGSSLLSLAVGVAPMSFVK